ncbi:hypothetical protein JCM31598_08130 [Desulfonatronum parangueonense]
MPIQPQLDGIFVALSACHVRSWQEVAICEAAFDFIIDLKFFSLLVDKFNKIIRRMAPIFTYGEKAVLEISKFVVLW